MTFGKVERLKSKIHSCTISRCYSFL